jgi:predicted nucleic acid-binding protein
VSAYYDGRIPYIQDRTKAWWDNKDIHAQFDFYISQITINELQATKDPKKRTQFLKWIENLEVLELSLEIEHIATHYLKTKTLREKALADAFHLAYASHYKMDYLVTWNIADLAKPGRRQRLRMVNTELQIWTPEIITPEFFEL